MNTAQTIMEAWEKGTSAAAENIGPETMAKTAKTCKRCGVSEEFEMLAYRGDKLVCQECDSQMEHEWVAEDPCNRKHYLDTFNPA